MTSPLHYPPAGYPAPGDAGARLWTPPFAPLRADMLKRGAAAGDPGMDVHDTPEKDYNLERLLFFSDGVFAIVITLLALELRVPATWDHTLPGLWHDLWRPLSAFAVSFAAVGLFWNSHRTTFAAIVAFRPPLVFFNLLFLGLITLLPFLTTLLYEKGFEAPREIVAVYIVGMAAIALTQAMLWGYVAITSDLVSRTFRTSRRWILLGLKLSTPVLLMAWAWLMYTGRPQSDWLIVAAVLAAFRLMTRQLENPRRSLPKQTRPAA